jgi:hypothetical protein
MELFAFENRRINAGQNVLGFRNQPYQVLVSDRSHILLAIQGMRNHGIASFAFKIGVDQAEDAALAFVDRRIGNVNLESLETAYLCEQRANGFPSLDGVHNWLNIIKQQLVALAESFEVFLELPCCPKS